MYEYRFTVGYGERGDGRLIDVSEAVRRIERIKYHAAQQFGGYTLTRGRGGWVNGHGRLVTEPVATFAIATDDPIGHVRDFAHRAANTLGQASFVFVGPGGEMGIVNAEPGFGTVDGIA